MKQCDDSSQYNDIAKAFVVLLLISALRAFVEAGFVSRQQVASRDPEAVNALFVTAFNLLAVFEDLGGFEFRGRRFFAHALLSTSLSDPLHFIDQVRRAELHGNVGDEELEAAFAAVELALDKSRIGEA